MKTFKIALCAPYIRLGDTAANARSIIDTAAAARRGGAKLAVFPPFCLTGAGARAIFSFAQLKSGLNTALSELSKGINGITALVGCPGCGRRDYAVIGEGGVRPYDGEVAIEDVKVRIGRRGDANALTVIPILTPLYAGTAKALAAAAAKASLSGAVAVIGAAAGDSSPGYLPANCKLAAANGTVTTADFDDRRPYVIESVEITDAKPANNGDFSLKPFYRAIENRRDAPYLPLPEECDEILDIMARGIYTRLKEIGCKKMIFGLSGGLDSALTALAAARVCDRYGLPSSGVLAVTMPGPASSERTAANALRLRAALGFGGPEIPISRAVLGHLRDIGHDSTGVVYENAQARERAQILLDLSNKYDALVLGTSDLSEEALGWSTYGGDQLAQYNPNRSLTKSAIRRVAAWYAAKGAPDARAVVADILSTPVSPELVEGQETETLLGSYEIHDFYLYQMIYRRKTVAETFKMAEKRFRVPDNELKRCMKIFTSRVFKYQFKRLFGCDGAAVLPYGFDGADIHSGIDAALWTAAADTL